MPDFPYIGLHNLIQVDFTVTHTGPLASCTSAHMLQAEGILEVIYEDNNSAIAILGFNTVLRTNLTGQIIIDSIYLISEQ